MGAFDDLIASYARPESENVEDRRPQAPVATGGAFSDLIAQYKQPAEDVTAGMALRGVPFGEYLIPRAEAAIRAARGQGTGETWQQRYENLVPQRERLYQGAEEQSPYTSGALKIGGGLAALGGAG